MPKNTKVIDPKPKMSRVPKDFGTEQLFTVVINANQYMGLPFLLTYTTAGTVLSPVTR